MDVDKMGSKAIFKEIMKEIKAIRKIQKGIKKMDDDWRKKHGRNFGYEMRVEQKLNLPLRA